MSTVQLFSSSFISEQTQDPRVINLVITGNFPLTTLLHGHILALKVLVATIDTQWEGMGDVGSARYEPVLLPPCPTIRVKLQ